MDKFGLKLMFQKSDQYTKYYLYAKYILFNHLYDSYLV